MRSQKTGHGSFRDLRLMTKFIPKGVSFVFFCTKAKKNGIIETEKG